MKILKDKVILITGVSSGLGKDLAQELLNKGVKVVGTFRKASQAEAFEKANPEALGIVMDITDPKMVADGVEQALSRFGRIDILANNAGVGAVGAVEEMSDEETRKTFEVNYFGGLSVIRAVLPAMRKRRAGHILLFSAIGGFHGVPGFGLYASAKSATIVLGESLASELKPLGIDVTVLTIGVFDTGMATRVMMASREIDDYSNTPAAQFKNMIRNLAGREPNDPKKAAHAITKLMESENPPVNTALGADALDGMRKKIKSLEVELNAWEGNAISTTKDLT